MIYRKRKLNDRYYVLSCVLKEFLILTKPMKKAIHKKDDVTIIKELLILLDETNPNEIDKLAWLRIFYKNFVYDLP